jgi:calpain-15
MCINGEWRAVVIDDMFPCRPKNKHPAFCSSKSKELWPMVLEKAWAKVFKSYDNIIAGNPEEVLRALTGGVTWKIKTTDENFE